MSGKRVNPEVGAETGAGGEHPALQAINSHMMQGFITLLTLYALFGDDIRLAATPRSADDVFYSLSCIALFFFTVEITANALWKPGYSLGFYFWLDLASTISLIPDIGWIWEPLTGTDGDSSGGSTAALKAGRASRAGTKAGRIVRIVRLVRMVRIFKLYKTAMAAKNNEEEDVESAKTTEELIDAEPSKVGKKLTELTTRRVIILVLAMILFLPIIDGGLTSDEFNEYQEYAFKTLHRLPQEFPDLDEAVYQGLFEEFGRAAGVIVWVSMDTLPGNLTTADVTGWLAGLQFQPTDSDDITETDQGFTKDINPLNDWDPAADLLGSEAAVDDELRVSERTLVEAFGCFEANTGRTVDTDYADCLSSIYFDNRSTTQADAVLSLVKTLVVMVVLAVSVIGFSRDASSLVIEPVERMMRLVRKLAENPLGDDDAGHGKAVEEGSDETALLEKTLSKIGGLLRVGFGVAGAEIIGKNMGAGELNVMIPGKRITSVFGFGIIESFTETCTCLEDQMCVYINTIASIVHGGTHAYHGAANKNIGSAFLLAWKICDGLLPHLRDPRDPPPDGTQTPAELAAAKAESRKDITRLSAGAGRTDRALAPQEFVDSALTAFLKVRVDLQRANQSGPLVEFANHPRMIELFGADFEVSMGFGLHMGWAIEGAIGSRFKIDASYLSPNVNMAARLEAATHQFGCPMLMSGFFVDELSPAARRFCRLIDRVTVKGSQIPMDIYTFDIGSDVPDPCLEPRINEAGEQEPVDFEHDAVYAQLRASIAPDFFDVFDDGVNAYLQGDWPASKGMLERAQALKPDDGPTKSLLRVMGKTNFASPADWAGVRELTSK